ncbi:MAG: hypothetical protein H6728_14295 [Myxococcales bacterium]|nr:hypothetical protein [Myxococcales bacterium]MCB9644243.1 hypothetical protein [Myxococcales bacterium]
MFYARKKSLFVLFVLLFSTCFSQIGCDGTVTFDVPTSGNTTVLKGTLLEEFVDNFGFGNFLNMDISTSQEFKSNNVARERVTKTVLTKLTLTIESPEGQNFDFLQKVTFFVEASGLAKQEVATADIPTGSKTVTFTPTGADIGAYIRAEKFSITTEVKGRRPTQDTTVRADAVFQVSARVL